MEWGNGSIPGNPALNCEADDGQRANGDEGQKPLRKRWVEGVVHLFMVWEGLHGVGNFKALE